MRALSAVALVLTALLGGVAAQQPPAFRTASDLVVVDTLVLRGRNPVRNLTADDFEVLDNGVRQDATVLDVPGGTHVVAAVDTSASVKGDILDNLVKALRAVTSSLTEEDRISVVTFGERLKVLAHVEQPGPSVQAVIGDMTAAGGTLLHDAVVVGAALAAADERPALLLVLSDGADTSSATSAPQVLDLLRASDVVTFTIGAGLGAARVAIDRRPTQPYFDRDTWIAADPADASHMLRRVAELTGGSFVSIDYAGELTRTFTDVLARYRSRYILSYTPTGVGTDDGWHTIEVRLKGKRGTVFARKGYYAGDR